MSSNNNANTLVLVTGVTGYVAAAVFKQLLERGYKVRGTVRSQEKAERIKQKYAQFKDQIETVIVGDVAAEGALDAAAKGVQYVHHIASPFHLQLVDAKRDFLDPAINGTVNALKSAQQAGTVKRVIITSSFASILDLSKTEPTTYTEEDWNPVTYEQAAESKNPGFVYCASKKLAEKAAWDFVEKEKPGFDLVTLCPPMVYGPMEQDVTIKTLNESSAELYEALTAAKIPTPGFHVFVDIRDLTKAHVLAQEDPKAGGNRYLVAAGNYLWEDAVDAVKKNHPEFTNFTKGESQLTGPRPPYLMVPNSTKVKKHFGIDFISFEKSITDATEQLAALAK